MYVYQYICISIYMYINICMYIMCLRMYMYIYIHMHYPVHICASVYMYVYVNPLFNHPPTYLPTHPHPHPRPWFTTAVYTWTHFCPIGKSTFHPVSVWVGEWVTHPPTPTQPTHSPNPIHLGCQAQRRSAKQPKAPHKCVGFQNI